MGWEGRREKLVEVKARVTESFHFDAMKRGEREG